MREDMNERETVKGVDIERRPAPPTCEAMFDELLDWLAAKRKQGAESISVRGAMLAASDLMAESWRQYAARCLDRGRAAKEKPPC
jgi:hypothetical protein